MVTGKDFEAVSQLGRLLTVQQQLTLITIVMECVVLTEDMFYFSEAIKKYQELFDEIAVTRVEIEEFGVDQDQVDITNIIELFEWFSNHAMLCEASKKL